MMAFLEEVGSIAGIFIIFLYIAVLMDGFVMFNIMVRQIAEAKEYADAVLKWFKIVILYAAGVLMIFYVVGGGVSLYITVIEAVLGVLLFADAVLSTVIKSKYGRKKK